MKRLSRATLYLAALFIFVFIPVATHAQDDPFVHLANSAISFFTPMQGTVTSAFDNTVTSDLNSSNGIQVGMRLEITRPGAPFLHPVTKEQIGVLESHVGKAEVIAVTADSSTLRVMKGTPQKGDILRISSALVRTLFFQSSDVDWNVSQEYYEMLQDTGRLNLLDTAPGAVDEDAILNEARNKGAEVVLILTSAKKGDDLILKQRLLWVNDGRQISADMAAIGPEMLADIRLGSELFTPKKSFVVSFDIPYSVQLVSAGDIDGDGKQELIMGTYSSLSFYNADKPQEQLFGDLEYDGPNSEQIIWLDVYDLDGDKKDELVITSKSSKRVISRIFSYEDGKLVRRFKDNQFLRVIDGKLYGQDFNATEGYRGAIHPVSWNKSAPVTAGVAFNLPEGVNLYDFNFIENLKGEKWLLAFDPSGHLDLYDTKLNRVWTSLINYGEGVKSFNKMSASTADAQSVDDTKESLSREEWMVNERIYLLGRSAVIIDRAPVQKRIPGIGIRNSQIMGLNWMENSFQEVPMFKDISGNVKDVSIIGDKIFILTRPPMGFDAKKLLKGKNPLINKLYIYSLTGV